MFSKFLLTRLTVATLGAILGLGIAAKANFADRQPGPNVASSHPAPIGAHQAKPTAAAAPAASLITEYCLECHDKYDAKGELVLEGFDVAHPENNAEVAEKIIRKLRAGLMPPPEASARPETAAIAAFVTSLETQLDKSASLRPNPGSRSFVHLTRSEYEASVRDLLALDVDVNAFLPPDTVSHGFDNLADAQPFSPALMEGYMRAASKISRLAVGDKNAAPTTVTYKIPRTASQFIHVEGTPVGTRGGIAVVENFPADGDYVFKVMLHGSPTGELFGMTARGEQLEFSVNGERVALLEINPRMTESDPAGLNLQTEPIHVKAGPQRVAAAFVQRFAGPVDDLIEPIEHTLADSQIGMSQGITTLPHVRDMMIIGPSKVTGVSETPSRRKIFECRPTTAVDEQPCATKILSSLVRQAYRRPVKPTDLPGLMAFYDAGRKGADFDSGIRTALQAILASPNFVFRFEETPANIRPGQSYRLNDLDVASRLSFFLWGAAPDAELITVASQGGLKQGDIFEKQVRRMLADPRAETLSTRFASQWLRLQDLEFHHPDALLYPHYDATLGDLMKRQTELSFDAIVREDRPVLDLLDANYTFVNDRLADYYGMAPVFGSAFRKVPVTDDNRRGVLGQGSILVLTSEADRTSPVQRGKWVLEVLLGAPPPPPPANIPPFEDTKAVQGGKPLSVRERMEMHRKNPTCNSCHRMMDPIGLSLENFDVTGAWRIKDNGVAVDPLSKLYDGSPLNGPASLRQALLKHSDVLLRNFTDRLMTYALGRKVEAYDMPTIRGIVRDAAANGNKFSSFVLGIVKSPAFQMGRAEEAPAASAAKGSSRR